MFAVKCVLLQAVLLKLTSAGNILAIFPMASISHNMLYTELMLELHRRGHNITIMTTNPLLDEAPKFNYTEIDLSFLYDRSKNKEFAAAEERYRVEIMYLFYIGLEKHAERIFQLQKVQEIIHGGYRFDAVVLEWSVQPSISAFSEHFQCPLIGIRPMVLKLEGYDVVSNPFIPSYMALNDMDFETDFTGRLINVVHTLVRRFMYQCFVTPRADKLVYKYFKNHHHYIGDVEKNVSIVLMNTYPVLNGAMPLVPGIVEIGGLYIQNNNSKPLPKDVKKFLDESTEGVILFSLGSVVQSWDLSDEKIEVFLKIFSQLPYKVLWRFDPNLKIVNKPDNIMFYKWISQREALVHPNMRLFITHAGLRSTEESLAAHIPMVCIPFFVDQYWNCRQVDKLKAGKRLYLKDVTEKSFMSTVKEVLEDKSYKRRAVEVGKIMLDQPIPPLEKAVWWIEYVLRNNGAHHLKTEGLWMSWITYHNLDIFIFIIVILLLVCYVLFKICTIFVRIIKNFKRKYVKID